MQHSPKQPLATTCKFLSPLFLEVMRKMTMQTRTRNEKARGQNYRFRCGTGTDNKFLPHYFFFAVTDSCQASNHSWKPKFLLAQKNGLDNPL